MAQTSNGALASKRYCDGPHRDVRALRPRFSFLHCVFFRWRRRFIERVRHMENAHATKSALAETLRVGERTIERLVQKGVLVPENQREGRLQVFDLAENMPRYFDHLVAKEDSVSAIADALLKKSRAIILELEAAELRGEVHRLEDVEHFYMEACAELRGMVLALPGRLAVDLANATDPKEVIARVQQEIDEILAHFIEQHSYDPKKYAERVRERRKWRVQADGTEQQGANGTGF